MGIDEESAPYRLTGIISQEEGLDVFIDGHSHSVVKNAKVKDKSGHDVILAQTGNYLSNIG